MTDSPSPAFGYTPREPFTLLHTRTQRFASVLAHRRAGKSLASVAEIVLRAMYSKKHNPRFAFVAPFRSQAKDVAWTYLKEMTDSFSTKIREADLRVELSNGAWITLYGSDNVDAIRGKYFDGVVVDEIADCRPTLFAEVLLPALTDRKGWILFIGTAKGKNHFYDLHTHAIANPDEWFSMTLRASESGIIPQEDLDTARSLMSEAQYEQEMECSFEAPVLGTYYAQIINNLELDGRAPSARRLYNPAMPVYAVFDLGFTDSTAIWFWQPAPDGLAVINYYEAHSEPLQHYFDYLTNTGYEFDTFWLPHDARAKTLQTGRSTAEQFIAFTRKKFPTARVSMVPMLKVQHGIDAARLVMPMCSFDIDAMMGVEMLRSYRRSYNALTKSFSDKPHHGHESHAADAYRYLSLVAKKHLRLPQPSAVLDAKAAAGYTNPFTTPPASPATASIAGVFHDIDAQHQRNRFSDRI